MDCNKTNEKTEQQKTTDDLLADLVAELRGIREELENVTLACRQINAGVRGAA